MLYIKLYATATLGKRKRVSHNKVSKYFSGNCQLKQLPNNTYFKLVKKDGTLSKKTYLKEKGSYNRWTRRYDICSCDDVSGAGREMSGKTLVSTRFTY